MEEGESKDLISASFLAGIDFNINRKVPGLGMSYWTDSSSEKEN